MNTMHRFWVPVAALTVVASATILISGWLSPTFAKEKGDRGKKIAGTYLAVEDDAAQTLQISEDGNLSFIFSIQFIGSGGFLDESFSNTFGSWKRTGKREITATTVDLSFETGDGTFIGVASATYVLKFDREFQTANVTCEGAIFDPGVNPFDANAEPISGSEFDCGGVIEFHRLPVDHEDDNSD